MQKLHPELPKYISIQIRFGKPIYIIRIVKKNFKRCRFSKNLNEAILIKEAFLDEASELGITFGPFERKSKLDKIEKQLENLQMQVDILTENIRKIYANYENNRLQ